MRADLLLLAAFLILEHLSMVFYDHLPLLAACPCLLVTRRLWQSTTKPRGFSRGRHHEKRRGLPDLVCLGALSRPPSITAILLLYSLGVAMASDLTSLPIPQAPTIHVRLSEAAGLSERMRTQSETIVIRLFRKAGLELEFVNCETSPDHLCNSAPGANDVRLQVLNHNLHGDVIGFAVLVPSQKLSDSYAAVSLVAAEAVAQQLGASVVDVLAASMAHEVGHLLLRASAHSRGGLMSPRLDRKEMRLFERGELTFTQEEATRLTSVGK
jgi:hypothetical protein